MKFFSWTIWFQFIFMIQELFWFEIHKPCISIPNILWVNTFPYAILVSVCTEACNIRVFSHAYHSLEESEIDVSSAQCALIIFVLAWNYDIKKQKSLYPHFCKNGSKNYVNNAVVLSNFLANWHAQILQVIPSSWLLQEFYFLLV